jgi:hypothetical protein
VLPAWAAALIVAGGLRGGRAWRCSTVHIRRGALAAPAGDQKSAGWPYGFTAFKIPVNQAPAFGETGVQQGSAFHRPAPKMSGNSGEDVARQAEVGRGSAGASHRRRLAVQFDVKADRRVADLRPRRNSRPERVLAAVIVSISPPPYPASCASGYAG